MQFTFAMQWPDDTWLTDDAFKVGATVQFRGLGGVVYSGQLVHAENQPALHQTLFTVEVADSEPDIL